jgi:hypothetical protein
MISGAANNHGKGYRIEEELGTKSLQARLDGRAKA